MTRRHDIPSRAQSEVALDLVDAQLRWLIVAETGEAVDRRVAERHKKNQRVAVRLQALSGVLSEIMGGTGDDCAVADEEDRECTPEELETLQDEASRLWPAVFSYLDFLVNLEALLTKHGVFLKKFMTEHAALLNSTDMECIRKVMSWLPSEIESVRELAGECERVLDEGLAQAAEENAKLAREMESNLSSRWLE